MRQLSALAVATLLAAGCNPMEPVVRQLLATPTATERPSAQGQATPSPARATGTPAAAATSPSPSSTPPPGPSATPPRGPSSTPPPTGIVLVPDPSSPLALVTKRRQLPASYVPEGLVLVNGSVRAIGEQRVRGIALEPLRRMVAEMVAGGMAPSVVSGYRSYATQEQTYAYWVRTLGQAQADRVSAKPGHSEHQLGLAVDFGSPATNFELEQTFANTAEGRWLAANARRFGFIMSYPAGKEALTGYDFEPWHFRYVGAEAQQIADRGLTLEEYLAGR